LRPRASRAILLSSLRRILPVDRITDELGALCYGPAHLSLGKEDGQPDSLPVG
jgi:GSH-dependent disulfide-bond oxidoreductase